MPERAGPDVAQSLLLFFPFAERPDKSPQGALDEDLPAQTRDRVAENVAHVGSQVAQDVAKLERGRAPPSAAVIADKATLGCARIDERETPGAHVVEDILQPEVAVKLPARPAFPHRGDEHATDRLQDVRRQVVVGRRTRLEI